MADAQQAGGASRRRTIGRVLVLLAFATVAGAAAFGIDNTPLARDDDAPSVDWSTQRAEYWRDVVVDVPGSWGYGGAPTESDGARVICDPRPAYDADGRRVAEGRLTPGGYVGRPLVLDDRCLPYPLPGDGEGLESIRGVTAEDGTRVPYVWLGADLPEEEVDLGGGFVQETKVRLGVAVTVGSYDARTRARVLGSIRTVSTCQARLSLTEPMPEPRYGGTGGPGGAAATLRVCGYVATGTGSDTGAGEVGLAWGVELGGSGLSAYREALDSPDLVDARCTLPAGEYEWVVLEFVDPGGSVLRRDVVHSTCGVVETNAASLQLRGDGTGGRRYGPAYEQAWSTGPAAGLRAVLPSLVAGVGAAR